MHVVAPDSGAGSIAGIDTGAAGGENAVALLAQWGGAQLLLALFTWVIVVRYSGLVPLAIAASLIDNAQRVAIGRAKPLATRHTPPGAASWGVAPLCAAMLVVSLVPVKRALER